MINRLNIGRCSIAKTIPLAFDESLSYLETLEAVLKKLEEIRVQTNSNTEFINNLDISLEQIESDIEFIKAEIERINAHFIEFERIINAQVDEKLNANYTRVLQLMSDYQIIFETKLDEKTRDLQEQIDNITIGRINILDPTTGLISPLEVVIQNVYDAVRYDAISCSEFEALNLTAKQFDDKQITAYNFDVNGKSILQA